MTDQGLYFVIFLPKLDLLGIFENMGFISTVGKAPRIAILRWNIRATETSSKAIRNSNQMVHSSYSYSNLGSYFLLVYIVFFTKEKGSQFTHTQNLHSNYTHGSEKRVTSCNVWICVPIYIRSMQFKFIFLNVFAIYLFFIKAIYSFLFTSISIGFNRIEFDHLPLLSIIKFLQK